MSPARADADDRAAVALAAAALVCAAAAGGCGVRPRRRARRARPSSGSPASSAPIPMVTATLDDPTESDTVVRLLDSSADIETSYGGNFVDSIDGYRRQHRPAAATRTGSSSSTATTPTSAPARRRSAPGDRIWWDYRYWSAAYRVPAVVGSWPEPFLHGYEGGSPGDGRPVPGGPTHLRRRSSAALEDEGVDAALERLAAPEPSPDELRILVGPWDAVRADRGRAPDRGGTGAERRLRELRVAVRAATTADRRRRRRPRGRAPRRAGLIAAVRDGDDQPTWLVTGTDETAAAGAAAVARRRRAPRPLRGRRQPVASRSRLPPPAERRARPGASCR